MFASHPFVENENFYRKKPTIKIHDIKPANNTFSNNKNKQFNCGGFSNKSSYVQNLQISRFLLHVQTAPQANKGVKKVIFLRSVHLLTLINYGEDRHI